MKTVIQGEARLARLGDANPNALKEHKLLQNAKAKKTLFPNGVDEYMKGHGI